MLLRAVISRCRSSKRIPGRTKTLGVNQVIVPRGTRTSDAEPVVVPRGTRTRDVIHTRAVAHGSNKVGASAGAHEELMPGRSRTIGFQEVVVPRTTQLGDVVQVTVPRRVKPGDTGISDVIHDDTDIVIIS